MTFTLRFMLTQMDKPERFYCHFAKGNVYYRHKIAIPSI